jgi:hypothetical protein
MEDCTITHRTEPLVRPVWNRVARWVFDDTGMDFDDGEVVVDELPGHISAHNAGDLEFLADGSLLVAAGEAGLGPSGRIPIDAPNGKILRIDPDDPGTPLVDNPLYRDGASGGREFVYASGFRNPFRLAVRESDGLIVAGDVGTDDIEELNVVRRGENYGYPDIEGPGGPDGSVDPVDYYAHSTGCATIIVGEFAPGLLIPLREVHDDVLVYLDFICGRIWAAEFIDGVLGVPTMSRRWLLGVSPGPQMADLTIGPDGAIYLVSIGPGPFPIYRMSRTK